MSRPLDRELRRAFAMLVAMLLLLGLAGTLAVRVATMRIESAAVRLTPALLYNDGVLLSMTDAQTELRAYTLLGQADALDPYENTVARVPSKLDRLADVSAGDGETRRRVEAQEQAIADWTAGYADPKVQLPPGEFDRSLFVKGRRLFRQIRVTNRAVEERLHVRLNEVRSDAGRTHPHAVDDRHRGIDAVGRRRWAVCQPQDQPPDPCSAAVGPRHLGSHDGRRRGRASRHRRTGRGGADRHVGQPARRRECPTAHCRGAGAGGAAAAAGLSARGAGEPRPARCRPARDLRARVGAAGRPRLRPPGRGRRDPARRGGLGRRGSATTLGPCPRADRRVHVGHAAAARRPAVAGGERHRTTPVLRHRGGSALARGHRSPEPR